MRSRSAAIAALFVGAVVFAVSAPAEDKAPPADAGIFGGLSLTSKKEPVQVSSDHLDFDYKSRRSLFRGDVEVVQGDVTLRSDALTIEFDDTSKSAGGKKAAKSAGSAPQDAQQQLKSAVAEGHVIITQSGRKATGDRAVFDQSNRTLVLSGHPVLEEGPNRVTGDRVVVHPDESRMEVQGENSRVKLTIFPKQGTPGPTPEATLAPAPQPTVEPIAEAPSDASAERPPEPAAPPEEVSEGILPEVLAPEPAKSE